MARSSKWIDSDPGDSTRRVARDALAVRLEQVWQYLKRVLDSPRGEIENVHQLRVFARRASAALEIFEPWLPPRRARWISKQIKRIRQAAGEARDFDVLLARWQERATQLPPGHATLLLDQIQAHRAAAQQPIDEIGRRLRKHRFSRKVEKLVDKIDHRCHDPARERYGQLASLALAELVAPFLQAGDAQMASPEALHAFRIQGKQVRYAMEVFAGAFDREFRQELYASVAAIQDQIGAINDHATAASYFADWQRETDSCAVRQVLESAVEIERHELANSRQEFLSWWSTERRNDLKQRFARYVPGCEATHEQPCPARHCE